MTYFVPIFSALVGAGLFSFIEFLITRKDKTSKQLEEIKAKQDEIQLSMCRVNQEVIERENENKLKKLNRPKKENKRFTGKTHTKEHKQYTSDLYKGIPKTEESKRKIVKPINFKNGIRMVMTAS